MHHTVDRTIEILERTPRVLHDLLGGLDAEWTDANYGPDTFSPFDVVGHLIHGEHEDWIAPARIILEHGPDRPFDPFDRYAMYETSKGKSMPDLLTEFATLRTANIGALHGLDLQPEQLALEGTHPALGRVTLGELLATWTVHDLHHVGQICRAMSFQLGDAVGPWREYLSVLRPPQSG